MKGKLEPDEALQRTARNHGLEVYQDERGTYSLGRPGLCVMAHVTRGEIEARLHKLNAEAPSYNDADVVRALIVARERWPRMGAFNCSTNAEVGADLLNIERQREYISQLFPDITCGQRRRCLDLVEAFCEDEDATAAVEKALVAALK